MSNLVKPANNFCLARIKSTHCCTVAGIQLSLLLELKLTIDGPRKYGTCWSLYACERNLEKGGVILSTPFVN